MRRDYNIINGNRIRDDWIKVFHEEKKESLKISRIVVS
jgi:hypothetical protein